MTKVESSKPKGEDRPLNIRGFPDDLYWLIRVNSARKRLNMKAYIIDSLRRTTAEDEEKLGGRKSDD